MDTALVSAGSGLLGAAIGGLTAFATNWTIQQAQIRATAITVSVKKRQRLYNHFITEASRLFGDALTHENGAVTSVIQLYAIIASLRMVSSRPVIIAAEHVMEVIVNTYLAPNRTLRELADIANRHEVDLLFDFGEAARSELASLAMGQSTPLQER